MSIPARPRGIVRALREGKGQLAEDIARRTGRGATGPVPKKATDEGCPCFIFQGNTSPDAQSFNVAVEDLSAVIEHEWSGGQPTTPSFAYVTATVSFQAGANDTTVQGFANLPGWSGYIVPQDTDTAPAGTTGGLVIVGPIFLGSPYPTLHVEVDANFSDVTWGTLNVSVNSLCCAWDPGYSEDS